MNVRMTFVSCVVAAALQPWCPAEAGSAEAVGTFVPAADRKDMVYDEKRDLLYISDQDRILRYSVATSTFLPPVMVGGSPLSLDLSPDASTLAIADAGFDAVSNWIKLVDLDGLQVRKLELPREFYEAGTWGVSYVSDGSVVATSNYQGGGFTPMRRIDATSGDATVVANVVNRTRISASGDRRVVVFAETVLSNGPWGRYDAISGDVVRRGGAEDGTSLFNYAIATNAVGNQYAISTFGGTLIYDATFANVATLGIYGGSRPLAVAYDPVDNLAYFPWGETSEVRVYDMDLLTEVGAYDVGYIFSSFGNADFGDGRVRLSGDGSLLMVSVAGGVRVVRMYAPLEASSFSVTVPARLKHKIRLQGSIGNDGALAYEIVTQPKHGHVTLSRGYATYAGRGTGPGTDNFVYRVRYGRAVAEGLVTVNTR